MSTSRIKYFDLVRAFGIILMIMGHVGFGNEFDHWIHAFHMPIFFIISGYFYSPEKSKNWLKNTQKKIKTIIVPYIIFGIFHIVLYSLIFSYSDSYLRSLLWDNSQGIPIAGALWFLTASFFCEVIYSALDGITCNAIKNIGICGLVIVGLCANLFPIRLPLSIGVSLVGIGLYHIGRMIHAYKDKNWINFAMNMNSIPLACMCVGGG